MGKGEMRGPSGFAPLTSILSLSGERSYLGRLFCDYFEGQMTVSFVLPSGFHTLPSKKADLGGFLQISPFQGSLLFSDEGVRCPALRPDFLSKYPSD
jgi:hypothetical protein